MTELFIKAVKENLLFSNFYPELPQKRSNQNPQKFLNSKQD